MRERLHPLGLPAPGEVPLRKGAHRILQQIGRGAAGRTYLAESGNIVTLPDLEPVFPEDPWVLVSRVTECGGRPVAVLVQDQCYPREPRRLCSLFLDTDTPEKVVIPWSVPPQVHDLLATPDGTIVVSSAEGVHVLDVDPVP